MNQKVRFKVVLRFTHLPPRFFVHFLVFFVKVRPVVVTLTSATEMRMPLIGPVGSTSL